MRSAPRAMYLAGIWSAVAGITFACSLLTRPPLVPASPLAPNATGLQPVPTAAAPAPAGTSSRVVVIDSDMASDDWMAMLYLFHRPEITIKAITISGTGEAHCEPGVRNALALLALAEYPGIPVACGRTTPLQGTHVFPDTWRQAVDSLMGLSLPEPADLPDASSNAVDVLTAAIQASPQKVSVLTLGPLTNIAEALQKTPSLARRLEMIYIMGGALDVPGNIASTGVGIDNEVAEWNIYIDPHAAGVVFRSGAPITLVPLDATNDAPVTPAFYERLRASHRMPEAGFVFDLYSANPWLYQSGTTYFWDPVTAAILSDGSLAQYEQRSLCVVEEEGPTSGQIKIASGCPLVRAALSLDRERFESLFLDILNTQINLQP